MNVSGFVWVALISVAVLVYFFILKIKCKFLFNFFFIKWVIFYTNVLTLKKCYSLREGEKYGSFNLFSLQVTFIFLPKNLIILGKVRVFNPLPNLIRFEICFNFMEHYIFRINVLLINLLL